MDGKLYDKAAVIGFTKKKATLMYRFPTTAVRKYLSRYAEASARKWEYSLFRRIGFKTCPTLRILIWRNYYLWSNQNNER